MKLRAKTTRVNKLFCLVELFEGDRRVFTTTHSNPARKDIEAFKRQYLHQDKRTKR